MTIATLTFAPPVRHRSKAVTLDYELFESAIALFEQGNVAKSVQTVFAHLFPEQENPDIAVEPFSFPQGSSRVNVTVADEHILISVPLVKLPDGGNGIAALRFLLTKISGSGQLHQPRLRGNDVYLEFRDRLSRMHPYKLVEVLRRMPIEADNNDDWLIGQFSAARLEREAIPPVSDAEFDLSVTMWRSHWNDVEELLKESQRKRSTFFLNELTAYTFYRMRFALPLHGFINAKLSEFGRVFNNSDEDPSKREITLAKCIKDMKAVSDDDLRSDLGHPSYSISPNAEGTGTVLGSYFGPGNYAETIEQYRTTGKSIEAALALISTFTFLLGRYAWAEPIDHDLQQALADVSGKPWREIAVGLTAVGKELLEKYGDDEDGDSDDDEDGDPDDDGKENEEG
jgi:hypothetical protein